MSGFRGGAFVVVGPQRGEFGSVTISSTVHYDFGCSHVRSGRTLLGAVWVADTLGMRLRDCTYCGNGEPWTKP